LGAVVERGKRREYEEKRKEEQRREEKPGEGLKMSTCGGVVWC
jgi:hypothetical protein